MWGIWENVWKWEKGEKDYLSCIYFYCVWYRGNLGLFMWESIFGWG